MEVTPQTLGDAIGVNPLTGEACAYMMRVLCDVNEEGANLLRAWWSLPADTKFGEPWNSRVGAHKAVGSVMLHPSEFGPLTVFYARRYMPHAIAVLTGKGCTLPARILVGSDAARYQAVLHGEASWFSGEVHRCVNTQGPRVGDRMVHVASGRAS